MAKTLHSYDHPNAQIVRHLVVGPLLGTATTIMARFTMPQQIELIAVHSRVQVAGTNAAAGVDIYNGTTSVASITHGTDAAGTAHSAVTIGATVAEDEEVRITGLATSATMVNTYTIQYRVLPGAVIDD